MKTILNLLTAIFISTNICNSQSYFSFPDSNAIWQVEFGGYQCGCCASYHYSFDGDTTINFTVYHKIHVQGVRFSDNYTTGLCSTNIIGSINNYSCAIRSDTSLKKVYIVPKDSITEYLLYDFNLQVGDTLISWLKYAPYSVNFPSDTIIISSVDSILINNQYRKLWNLAFLGFGTPGQIIDGIGSTGGPFYEPLYTFEAGGWISCFQQNNQTIYPDTNTVCNITYSKEFLEKENYFIYPNPFTSKIFVSCKENNAKHVTFKLKNILGEIVFYKFENILSDEYSIDLTTLSKGIYFLEILVNGERAIKKIVKD